MAYEVDGTVVETDKDGYITDVDAWTPELAMMIASCEQVELTEDAWAIIRLLREYYEEYQIAPAVRILTRAIGERLGPDKGSSKYLYSLFPHGPAQQACKIAGLPKPTSCI
jgi:tRNA 2-thiouridine synthesizing protein E